MLTLFPLFVFVTLFGAIEMKDCCYWRLFLVDVLNTFEIVCGKSDLSVSLVNGPE